MLFGKHEEKITKAARKGYGFWLLFSFAAVFLLFRLSEWLINTRWGYYGEWGDPLKIPHRLMSAGTQWLVCIAYTAFCFLLMMKVRFGNRLLAWLGTVTLDFYLMHGIFTELFGYSFLDMTKSLFYIKNVPLYVAAVIACTVPSALLFRMIRLKITGFTQKTALPPAKLTHG